MVIDLVSLLLLIVENFRVDSWTVCFHKALVNSTVFEGKRRIVYEVCETDDVLQVPFLISFLNPIFYRQQ